MGLPEAGESPEPCWAPACAVSADCDVVLDAVGVDFAGVSQDESELFFEEGSAFIEHAVDWYVECDVVADDFFGFFGCDFLVGVVPRFDKNCWADAACADAAGSGYFAFAFDAELF
jgi:hypothetical protein